MPDELRIPADLIRRLPATFGPALNDQLRHSELLFPAERRQLEAELKWLAQLPRAEFDRLFAPLLDIEGRMDLPHWEPDAAGMSVREVGILARSPLYPQWRTEVEQVFARIDAAAEQSGDFQNLPRLLVCILPAGLSQRPAAMARPGRTGDVAFARPAVRPDAAAIRRDDREARLPAGA